MAGFVLPHGIRKDVSPDGRASGDVRQTRDPAICNLVRSIGAHTARKDVHRGETVDFSQRPRHYVWMYDGA